MGARYEEFAERFKREIFEPGTDLDALVDELMTVHAEVDDELDRVRLISLLIAATNAFAKELATQAPDAVIPFLRHNLSRYHLMLRHESLVEGVIDRAKLLRVTEREIGANRMKSDDPLRAYAEGGDYQFPDLMSGLFQEGNPKGSLARDRLH